LDCVGITHVPDDKWICVSAVKFRSSDLIGSGFLRETPIGKRASGEAAANRLR
jgi:hypothetical protein